MLQLIVNILGTLTVVLCAWLLLRGYSRVRKPLLLWCGLCFAGLALANLTLILDYTVFADFSLYRLRLGIAAGAMLLMLYGLIFESDQP
jgi:hypothetical protein